MKIALSAATATQLAVFAQTNYGIDANFRAGTDKLIALLRNVGFDGDEIEVEGPEPIESTATRVMEPVEVVAPARPKRRMARIEIATTDTPGSSEGREPVPVSVNGSLMYIPRGKAVDVPYEYYEALKNAKYRFYDTPENEFSPVGEAREVPRFPISVHHIDPDPAQEAA